MGKIKQMDETLANQIAAGEIVERPASVVKELVENAIDAGSTDIVILLKEAGIQQIIVSDNGEGMDESDLEMAFLPHATSKIFRLSDLQRIHSLGFRGEALASIGSVAKVRIESTLKESADKGHFIEVEGSSLSNKGITKAKSGTTVIVDSLFYNTPARLKHLSSTKTELKHILNFIQDTSMAHPEIRFQLTNNDQRIFLAYGNGDLRQTIANVYQPQLAREMIAIQNEDNDFNLEGFISPPSITRTSRQYIHWLVNHRPIKSNLLTQVLIKAYGKQLMIGRYPIAVIHIHLDPRLVDVNVHPNKQTVRFSKEEELAQLITETIQKQLMQLNPVPKAAFNELNPQQVPTSTVETMPLDFNQSSHGWGNPQINENKTTDPKADFRVSNDENPNYQTAKPVKSQNTFSDTVSATEDNFNESQLVNPSQARVDFNQLRYVGQIHGTYLIAEYEDGFYLIDQHAAQEKIRYEQMMADEYGTDDQQQLLFPIVFNFRQSEMAEIEDVLPRLANIGIELQAFGPSSYQLESYPNWLDADQVEKIVGDMTELLIEQPTLTIAQVKEKSIIMQSCRGAIKANHYLDKAQAISLIHQMAQLKDPYFCPHGRPVLVAITSKTLEKLFKRIQDPHETPTFF
ncbi:DNA mismatch repair endonuclease MutL [Fundicoccus culcitae]|uniref:DNA mismatch repair protein MutL n=1 Tax=Fundicoccus culcitae TaxID=2969821 RepID=A0ABY5P7I5_9LACT|nr:DNA mismatch repair endonuclease MutL [Fundicoccus culcitae]UUX34561.1 DNA mismatch repair endonuclease MutL [Fundicoccus culcitae]